MTARHAVILVLYAALLGGGWLLGHWLFNQAWQSVGHEQGSALQIVIASILAVYLVASALPFVPGAEIGFGLILMLGGRVALLVWLAMVVALMLSFLVGRFVPLKTTAAWFRFIGLTRAANLVTELDPLTAQQRLTHMTRNAPVRFLPALIQHRYLALMAVLNLPGNSLIGGGGGIALIAGLSGVFTLGGFLAAIALAAAPVPLFFWLTA
jgi:hypothetical protein